MAAIVIPFRGLAGKQRIAAPEELRSQLALAMLGDVVTACVATDRTLVVTRDPEAIELTRELGAEHVDDPGGGQGGAVASGLAELPDRPVLVINADLPCVVPQDLRTFAGTAELGAFGFVEAEDGTTNALALPRPQLFAPLYGAGSATRFREHAVALRYEVSSAAIPNLIDDVDTRADLDRLALRVGPRTQGALDLLREQ